MAFGMPSITLTDRSASARLIDDHDGGLQNLRHFGSDCPPCEVHRIPRRQGDDHLNGLGGIGLGEPWPMPKGKTAKERNPDQEPFALLHYHSSAKMTADPPKPLRSAQRVFSLIRIFRRTCQWEEIILPLRQKFLYPVYRPTGAPSRHGRGRAVLTSGGGKRTYRFCVGLVTVHH